MFSLAFSSCCCFIFNMGVMGENWNVTGVTGEKEREQTR